MKRPVHRDTTETEEQNVEKIKTVFPNSLQGNGRTPKWKDQELISLPGKMGKSRSMRSCVGMLLVSGSHTQLHRKKRINHWNGCTGLCKGPFNLISCSPHGLETDVRENRADRVSFLGQLLTGSGQASFQQKLQRKQLCLQLSSIHLHNPSLKTSLFSFTVQYRSKPSDLITLCMKKSFPAVVLNSLPDHLLSLPKVLCDKNHHMIASCQPPMYHWGFY